MLARHVDPSTLTAVRYRDGRLGSPAGSVRATHVLADALRSDVPYLNTYSRSGALKVSRGCTCPITREALKA